MPKNTAYKSILILGAGPIVIGQACEFDYSGAQACKALKEEGVRVILVNSNPATIMTDPDTADATYIEPVTWQTVTKIIEKEKPDAILPTMGGQTALNCALDLAREGILEKYNVALIGANQKAIDMAEDREVFRKVMQEIGLEVPHAAIAHSLEEALQVQAQIGYPTIIRPSFTLGGSGGGIAYNHEEFIEICNRGLRLSPTKELLIEESLLGWKEYELEVVRDASDNCIIVCTIENFDPMGIHTGDSITVAPSQTLTDKEFQLLRNASIAILRRIGVDTGGANVQFGMDPVTGRIVVIEMNPRVSRSSALASKATGFPIAKVAAKLAIGYTLDELRNEITGGVIPCSFEPTLDYVVVKIPRFCFEKFPETEPVLTTQMKSVGEVMAIGHNFQEALQKAMRGLEIGVDGFSSFLTDTNLEAKHTIAGSLQKAGPHRLWSIGDAFREGMTITEIEKLTRIDPWFLAQIEDLIQDEMKLQGMTISDIDATLLHALKFKGFSDSRLATLIQVKEDDIYQLRQRLNIHPVYKRIDTCAAEFPAQTAYLYSTYMQHCEARPTQNKKVMILGGGPNRIGQGIEFDYCCVHTAFALREEGIETIMVNCNPETVSTDFDTSDRLYFEPLTLEDVLEIVAIEKPFGVIVQHGGQTPLKLAKRLEAHGVPILGTSPAAIDLAEDRERFQQLLRQLKLKQSENGIARNLQEAIEEAKRIGYPLVVRPSYVLGGRAMRIVFAESELREYMQFAVLASEDAPVLLDRFLEDAIEVDIDVVSDGKDVLVGGIMEHIEQAGIHSGDSSCVLPPYSLSTVVQDELCLQMEAMAKAIGVIGFMNAQFAIQGEDIYIIEVNPRASRTAPFVSKATGVPLAKVATRAMLGISLKEQGLLTQVMPKRYAIKQSVFPFEKFPGTDPVLGPEMKSTGEVMGLGRRFGEAFAKGILGSGGKLVKPQAGKAFLSVRDEDKAKIAEIAKSLVGLGFSLVATTGTAQVLNAAGIKCQVVNKVWEGRPNIVDMIKNDEIAFVVNTSKGRKSNTDSSSMRRYALLHKVSYIATIAGAKAACMALRSGDDIGIIKLQDI